MGQQPSQEQDPQQKSSKLLNWIDQRFIGPVIGALIAAIAAGRIVIQITGVQFTIGLLVLVTLVIIVVMGVSFFLGMGYILYTVVGLFTKQKPPLIYRVVANVMLIVMFPLWWKERRNTLLSSESFERMAERFRQEREPKDTQQ